MANLPIPAGAKQLPLPQISAATASQYIADVRPQGIFSALEPVSAMFPDRLDLRQRAIVPGENLQWIPGQEEFGNYYWILRELVDSCVIFRMVLTTVLDRLCYQKWQIRPIQKPSESEKDYKKRTAADTRLDSLTAFFRSPDGVHPFSLWLRMILEDIVVIDAGAVWKERDLTGKVANLRPIDGATLNVLVTDQGFKPPPDSPAHQQVLYGIPWYNATARDITYVVWNPRTWRRYGNSSAQQFLTYLALALRRQEFQLAEYTAGNIPEALCFLPSDLPIDRVKEVQDWFDTVLAGDLSNRRRLRFLPGYGKSSDSSKPNVIFSKEALLKDPLDDYLFQASCYCLGTTPQAMLRMMNRACHSAETETLTENGWKRFDKIYFGEKIATVSPENNSLEYHAPDKLFVYPFEGKLKRFKTQNVEVQVTPEHKMWLKENGSREYRKCRADAVPSTFEFQASAYNCGGEDRGTFHVPEVEKLHDSDHGGHTLSMDDWLEFLGYYLSEGGLSHAKNHFLLTLSQVNAEKAAKIEDCLRRTGFSWNRYPPQPGGIVRWNVYGKPLCTYLMQNVGGYCFDKRIPREFMSLCPRQLRILFDAYMLGDGSWDKRPNRKCGYAQTCSKNLSDDVQELAFKLGYSASVRNWGEKRSNRRPTYRVLISNRLSHHVSNSQNKKSVSDFEYRGPVYCFDVKNHLFVTRLNGKIAIHGNTAQQSAESAEEEGLLPKMQGVKDFLDPIIQVDMGYADLEFAWVEKRETDALKQAQVDEIYVNIGVRTRNQVRENLGDDPDESPMADELTVTTAQGVMPIDTDEALNIAQQKQDIMAPEPTNGNGKKPGAGGKQPKKKVSKRLGSRIEPDKLTRESHASRERIAETFRKVFRRQKERAKEEAGRLMKGALALALSAASKYLAKDSTDDDAQALADSIAASLQAEFDATIPEVQAGLSESMISGIGQGMLQIEVVDSAMIAAANTVAQDYARERAAELVGMRYDDDGNLIENPNAEYAITDTTRDKLRQIITDAFKQEKPMADIQSEIISALEDESNGIGIFSDARAELIARTEVMNAQVRGNFAVWQKSGLVNKVQWLTSEDEGVCPICEMNDGEIRTLGDPFPSGDIMPTAHPRCVASGTIVSAPDRVTAAYRRRFEQKLLTVHTSSGLETSVTPNHPILTDSGWVAAGALREGDDLVYCDSPSRAALMINPKNHLMPTVVENVARTLRKSGAMAAVRVPTSREHFHGDGIVDGEVEIVRPDGFLSSNFQSRIGEQIKNGRLCARHARRVFLDSLRSFAELPGALLCPAHGIMGRASIGDVLSFGTLAHRQPISVGDGAQRQPHPMPFVPQSGVMHVRDWREVKARLSGHISLMKVTRLLERYSKDGHVYNLETDGGFYLANGLVTSNCRCVLSVAEISE